MNMRKKRQIPREKEKEGDSNKLPNILKLLYLFLTQDFSSLDHYMVELSNSGLEYKTKTVESYLADINCSFDTTNNEGFKITYNHNQKQYQLDTGRYVFLPVTKADFSSFLMSVNYLSLQKGSPFGGIRFLKEILKGYITKSVTTNKETIKLSIPKVESNISEWFDIINDSINNKKGLLIKYKGKNETIIPFNLIIYDYEWYLRAFSCYSDEFYTYEINKIENLILKEFDKRERENYEVEDIPECKNEHIWDWPIDEIDEPYYFGHSEKLYKVRLKFTGNTAKIQEEKFKYRKEHTSQEIECVPYEIQIQVDNLDKNIYELDFQIEILERILDDTKKENTKSSSDEQQDLEELINIKNTIIKEKQELIDKHREVSIKERETNSELKVRYRVKNPWKMIPWILHFGASIEVLEPEWLRTKIKDEINGLRKLYDLK